MRATVQRVDRVPEGNVLAAALTIGDTTVRLLSAVGFDDDRKPHTVTIGGIDHTYNGIDWAGLDDVAYDTLRLVGAATVAGVANRTTATTGDVYYVAFVVPEGHRTAHRSYVRHALLKRKQLSPAALAGRRVEIRHHEDDDAWWVHDLIGQEPVFSDISVEGSITLTSGSSVNNDEGMPVITSSETESLFGLDARVTTLEGEIGGVGGSTTGQVRINCGNSSITGGIVTIDCGGAA